MGISLCVLLAIAIGVSIAFVAVAVWWERGLKTDRQEETNDNNSN